MVSSPAPTSTSAPSAASAVRGPTGPLEPDQLDLVGLGLELVDGVRVGGDPAREALALLDDLAHPGLDLLEVLRHERGLDVEVVVEAVTDRRSDAELGVREQVLHRLRQHVGGRVPQDVVAVGRVDGHALDGVPVGELVRQVAQGPVDPRGDHLRVLAEQLPRLGARRHRTLGTIACVKDGDVDVGHVIRLLVRRGPPVVHGRSGGRGDRIRVPAIPAPGFRPARTRPGAGPRAATASPRAPAFAHKPRTPFRCRRGCDALVGQTASGPCAFRSTSSEAVARDPCSTGQPFVARPRPVEDLPPDRRVAAGRPAPCPGSPKARVRSLRPPPAAPDRTGRSFWTCTKHEAGSLTGAGLGLLRVGDTGLEPVTSSV